MSTELNTQAVQEHRPHGGAAVRFLYPPRTSRHPWLHYLLEGPGWATLRVAGDLVATLVAVMIVLLGTEAFSSIHSADRWWLAFPVAVMGALYLRGLYGRRLQESALDLVGSVAGAVSLAAMTLIAVQVLVSPEMASGTVAPVWGLTIVSVALARSVLLLVRTRLRTRLVIGRRALVVGAGVVGTGVTRRLEEHPQYGLRPIGYLDADPPELERGHARRRPVLGSPDDIVRTVRETGAEHVILAFSSAPDHDLLPLVRRCEELGIEVSLVPRLFESMNDRVAIERLGGLPLHGLRFLDPKGWQFGIKYALDRPVAALLLLALAPLLLVAMLAVRLSSPGPIFFRQRRVGRDGRVFDLLKLRSMYLAPPERPEFVPSTGSAPGGVEGIDRRTPVGRFLRRTGIDELPQLINVLRGEMSLIGPRPERPEFVEMFQANNRRYEDRHRVKSGITGWAQVNGLRGQTSLRDRVELDNFYIENWSPWLDVKILLLTFGAILGTGDDA